MAAFLIDFFRRTPMPTSLFDLLIEHGVLDAGSAARVRRQAARSGFPALAVDLALDEGVLDARALAGLIREFGYEWRAKGQLDPAPEITRLLSWEFCTRRLVLPLELHATPSRERMLALGMSDPWDRTLIASVERIVEMPVRPIFVLARDLRDALDRLATAGHWAAEMRREVEILAAEPDRDEEEITPDDTDAFDAIAETLDDLAGAPAGAAACATPPAPAPRPAAGASPPLTATPETQARGRVGAGDKKRATANEAASAAAGAAPGLIRRDVSAAKAPAEASSPHHRTTVNFYEVMYHQRHYPLSVVIAEESAQVEAVTGARQAVGKEKYRVKPDDPVLCVIPQFPGCLVTPPQRSVCLAEGRAVAQFWVTPLVMGDLREAGVEVWQHGIRLDEVPTPALVTRQRLAKLAAFATALAAFSGAIGHVLTWTPAADLVARWTPRLPWLPDVLLACGRAGDTGLIMAGLLSLVAAGSYFSRMPRRAAPRISRRTMAPGTSSA